jgi:hypothetical protein
VNGAKLREWLEIVGILAVVASLVFVGLEIRQSSRAAYDESISSDYGSIVSVEAAIVENADVWLRGCRAKELSDVERMKFTHLYTMYEFMHFMRWLRDINGVGVGTEELALDNMAWNLYRSEGLMREWRLHGEWRSHLPDTIEFQRWRGLVEARLAEYPSFEPTPIDNVFRCGLI